MNRDEKAAVIEEVAGEIRDSNAVFAIDYRGISVRQAGDLRLRLGDAGASFRIVKNTLTERAADRAERSELKQYLEGPTAFAFVRGDAASAAKALAAFRRETRLLEFKGGMMGETVLSGEDIDAIARLPAREALQAQFVGVLASPLTGLVRGLAGLVSGLASQLGQIQEQGLLADAGESREGESPEPAEPGASQGTDDHGPEPDAPGDPVSEAAAAEEEAASGDDEAGS